MNLLNLKSINWNKENFYGKEWENTEHKTIHEIAREDFTCKGFEVKKEMFTFVNEKNDEVVGIVTDFDGDDSLFVYRYVDGEWVGNWERDGESMFPVDSVINVIDYIWYGIDMGWWNTFYLNCFPKR